MLLPSPPNSGSIGSATKMLGIAKLLEEKDCEVCFVIGGNLGRFFKEKGYRVFQYPIPKTSVLDIKVNNIVDFVEWTGLSDPDYIHQAVSAELEAIKEFCPDVIFAEARPSAAISARAAGIALVSIASWSCSPFNPLNKSQDGRLIEGFNRELRAYGQEVINNIAELFFMRSYVKLAPTLPELEPEIADMEGVKFTGYILDVSYDKSYNMDWYNSLGKENQIFIYLSVGALKPQVYIDTITNTFKDTIYNVICGCGFHLDIHQLPESLSNVKFVKYVPLENIIKNIKFMLFHGGQDTMLSALLNGIPSITFPGDHFERGYNAEKIEKLKLSKKCSIYSFRPSRMQSMIEEMLSGDYIKHCQEFRKVFNAYGGSRECVEILTRI